MDIISKLKSLVKRTEARTVIHTVSATGTFTKDGKTEKEVFLLSIDNVERSSTERWIPTKNGYQALYLHHSLTTSESYMRRFINEESMRSHILPPVGIFDLVIDWDSARVIEFTVDSKQDVDIKIL